MKLQVKDTYEAKVFGEIKDVIRKLVQLQAKHPEAITITIDQVWTGYEECHEEFNITRMETDKEYAARQAEERRRIVKARREAASRELKAKQAKAYRIEKLKEQLRKAEEEDV